MRLVISKRGGFFFILFLWKNKKSHYSPLNLKLNELEALEKLLINHFLSRIFRHARLFAIAIKNRHRSVNARGENENLSLTPTK
jgi:hypothetical protein